MRPDGAAPLLGLKPGNLDAVAGKKGKGKEAKEARKGEVRGPPRGPAIDAVVALAWLDVVELLQGAPGALRVTEAGHRHLMTIGNDVDYIPGGAHFTLCFAAAEKGHAEGV